MYYSFCGDEYDKWGEVDLADPADDDRRCNMTLEEDSSVEAGGFWAMSIYQLPDPDTNQVELNSGGTGTGDTTDVGGLDPVESGKRAFTVVNKCSSTIRVGSTGGR